MKRLLSSDPEGFDGPCGELLHRLYSRRQEIKTRLHQIEGNLLDGNLEGTSEHNRWVGNRCAPLIDDYVVVFNSGGISRRRRVGATRLFAGGGTGEATALISLSPLPD